jgi:hypothetical protein
MTGHWSALCMLSILLLLSFVECSVMSDAIWNLFWPIITQLVIYCLVTEFHVRGWIFIIHYWCDGCEFDDVSWFYWVWCNTSWRSMINMTFNDELSRVPSTNKIPDILCQNIRNHIFGLDMSTTSVWML